MNQLGWLGVFTFYSASGIQSSLSSNSTKLLQLNPKRRMLLSAQVMIFSLQDSGIEHLEPSSLFGQMRLKLFSIYAKEML